MEDWHTIIGLALGVVAVALLLFPVRDTRNQPRTRDDIRAEWQRERRHWAGAPDLREGDE